MRSRILTALVGVILLLTGLALAGCAGNKISFTVPEGAGEKAVLLKASSFGFEPSEIIAQAEDRLALQVENTAGIGHNLTVKDPQGSILFSLDLPAGQTQIQSLPLSQAGEYHFHCDKPLHATMGMTGRIVVDNQP